ncbi:MAG: heme utilization protein HuvX [Rhizobiales bacterium 65-9]|nr:heme utilization cystosolic carrier protein HutX [Hyphomicrobiales bacterium]OJY34267.1 MAG: heme utilization protein HuvX [Rhizobiales bacterium 65-9]
MSALSAAQADPLAAARAALAAKPDGVVDAIARAHGVPTQAVLDMLPGDQRVKIDGARFEDVWQTMTRWGEILFIVNTPDIVLECHGALVKGSSAQGYYNVHGDSPIGGHIKAANCSAIYVVDRPFHGRRSCSVQFFNGAGEAMFKVFVRRNKERELIPEQLALFEALKSEILNSAAA